MLEQTRARLQHARTLLERDKGALDILQRQVKLIDISIAESGRCVVLYGECLDLLEQIGNIARQQVLGKIEGIVQLALQYVFGPDYTFKLLLDSRASTPTVSFLVSSPVGAHLVEGDPRDARGGGVSDVVSLALRIALLELYSPKIRGPLILDEPCSRVDTTRAPRVAEFLRMYSERMNRQVILITHQQAFADVAEMRYVVSKNARGESVVSVDGGIDYEYAGLEA